LKVRVKTKLGVNSTETISSQTLSDTFTIHSNYFKHGVGRVMMMAKLNSDHIEPFTDRNGSILLFSTAWVDSFIGIGVKG